MAGRLRPKHNTPKAPSKTQSSFISEEVETKCILQNNLREKPRTHELSSNEGRWNTQGTLKE